MTRLRRALRYAECHKPIFPCEASGKRPLTKSGLKDATTDRSRIHGWFNRWPDANLAMPTGSRSGVWVLDVDRDHGGLESLRALEADHGPLPATYSVRTGGGGKHLYFLHLDGVDIRNSTAKLGPGLDVRGEGGYVLLPGSATESTYTVTRKTQAVRAPSWLVDMVRKPEPQDQPSRRREGSSIGLDDGGPILEGTRNVTLTSIGGRLRARGLDQDELLDSLLTINEARCTPPLETNEVSRIAASVCRYSAGDAGAGPCEKVRSKLAALEDAAGERPVVGMRGGTGWSIYNAGLEAARRHGVDHPAGVELSIDVRTWAQMAGTHAATVSRYIRRSPLVRQLRRGQGRRSGSVVLLVPREIGVQLQHSTTEEGSRERSVADRPLFRKLYRLRWGPGRIGKSRAALLTKVVECPGVSRSELAQRLGRKPASLKKPLKWCVDAGLLCRTGWGRYDVTDGFRERLDDLRVIGREPEADRLQIAQHNRQREGYRNRHKVKAERVPEHTTAELERLPDPDNELVIVLGEFLRRNPHRRGEEPGWFAVALWAEDLVECKPTGLEVEVALYELNRVAV